MAKKERGLHPYVAYLKNRYYNYGRFQEEEGIPSNRGFHVEDVDGLALAPWERKGGRGAFINLSEQEIDDAYVCEIAPGGSLKPQRHMFEEVIFVVEGRGATSLWNPGQEPISFEWQAGSLFAVPLNAYHQHFNSNGTKRVLLLGVTSAPLLINLFHDREFIFHCPYVFDNRFSGAADAFRQEAQWLADVPGGLWETNLIPDIHTLGMTNWEERGRKLKHTYIALASNTMKVHIAEFAVGTYKKAHRHGPGAHILILKGTGYSLMWRPGEEPRRFNWRPGTLVSPPAGWFHQHFNTGPEPVFHLAFHRPASIYNKNERAQIEYEGEDPQIRAMFEADSAKNGVQSQMQGRPSSERPMAKREKGLHPYVAYLKNRYFNYGRFQEKEGIPSLKGFHVEDVYSLPLSPWERKGGRGTVINLSDQELDDAYVCEIAPGCALKPGRYLYEEVIYVLEGRGATSIWLPGREPVSFEWKQGSLFAIPLNAHHQHFNGDGTRRALLLGVTSAPLLMNLFHDREFIFNCPQVFGERFTGAPDEFRREARLSDDVPEGLWETNFIADVRELAMVNHEERGPGSRLVFIALSANVMKVHIAEFPAFTYKKAHRHGAGAHILVLKGTGYSLMWPAGTEPRRFNWKPGSLISPPAGWFHQHFNTGREPVFYLALHRPVAIYNKGEREQIEYEDEAPEIRDLYAAEMAKIGAEVQMPIRR